jgi:hypothetical protein
LIVQALSGYEFIVGAGFSDTPPVEDDDTVGMAYSGESVGHDNGCAVPH